MTQIWQVVISAIACVVPLLIWWLSSQQRMLDRRENYVKELEKSLDKLDDDLKNTKNQIIAIHKQLSHRSEYAKLKYQILIDQIADLNNFLRLNSSFMPRKSTTAKDFPTMGGADEDDPPTGIF